MKLFKTRGFRLSASFVLALYFSLMLATSALATPIPTSGSATVSLAISGGSLAISVPATEDAGTVTLSTVDQTTSYTIPLTVNDPRGTGAGWDLKITATQFTTTSGTTHTLPANAQSVISATQVCHTNSTCTLPDNASPGYPVRANASSHQFYSAGTNTGMGQIDVTPTIQIAVPANAYIGTYSSTVNITLESIPT